MTQAPRDWDDIAVGDVAVLEHLVREDDIERFANLTGDDNPVHVDEAFARDIGLGGRVAHGMLTAGYVSTVIGTRLPGPGALWLSQSFSFRAPVRVGDMIRVEVRVRHRSAATRTVILDVEVKNQHDRVVLDGEARVHILDRLVGVTEGVRPDGAAVVTGAGRGLGAAIARRLAADGMPVVVNYRASADGADEVVRAIREAGGTATAFRADVCDREAVTALFDHAAGEHGGIAVLVSNAGGPPSPKPLSDTAWDDVETHLASHLRGTFLCVQKVLPGMIERGSGRIVAVTSQSAYGTPPPKMTGYVVAKAALAAFTRCVAVEAGPSGVTANCVAPGMMDTDLVADVPQRVKLAEGARSPLRRLADVSDIADTIAYLAGPGGRYVTGQTIHLSGGQVMP